jgi:ketosteroid isomerase-like protein
MNSRIELAKEYYSAFARGDRRFVEEHLADNFTFSAPPDPHLDRAGYFERCWPGAGKGGVVEFIRLIESGDEVVITYEAKQPNGGKGVNTEILTFESDKLRRAEVYFGWSTDPAG